MAGESEHESGVRSYEEWFPAPASSNPALPSGYLYANVAAIQKRTSDFDERVRTALDAQTMGHGRWLPFAPDAIEESVTGSVGGFVRVDADDVEGALTESEFSSAGSHGQVTLYEKTVAAGSVVAAPTDGLVVVGAGQHANAFVTAALDAKAGDSKRLGDVRSAMDTLFESLPTGDLVVFDVSNRGGIGTGITADATGTGLAWSFGAKTTDLTVSLAFEDERDPAELDELVANQGGFADYEWEDATGSADVLSVAGSLPTDEFDFLTPDAAETERQSRAPEVSFSFHCDAENERVTVTHNGGDMVETGKLAVVVGSDEQDVSFTKAELNAGDQFTVDVNGYDSNTALELRYVVDDDSAPRVLARYELQCLR